MKRIARRPLMIAALALCLAAFAAKAETETIRLTIASSHPTTVPWVGVMTKHVTFGFTKHFDADSSLDFAFMYAPTEEVDGTNTFDPAQEIELEMEQYELALSYNRRF